MKFRCERDTLAEAVATAQRTVASRSGALPVLQDLRITATGDGLELVGSDLEITNRVQVPAEVEETGVAVVPEAARRHRAQARARPGDGRGHRRRSGDHRRPLLDVVAPEAGRGLPAAGVERRAGRAASTRPRSRRRCARWCARRRRTICARSSRVCCSPRTRGGLRLVATDSYRLAVRDLKGVSMLEEGQRVLVAAKGLAEVQRLAGDGEIEVVLRERDVVFRTSRAEVTARLIEGDFPNYEQLIPSGYPEPAHRRRARR